MRDEIAVAVNCGKLTITEFMTWHTYHQKHKGLHFKDSALCQKLNKVLKYIESIKLGGTVLLRLSSGARLLVSAIYFLILKEERN